MIKRIPFVIITILLVTSCHTARFVKWNFVNQDDYKKFDNITIKKGTTPFNFFEHTINSSINLPKTIKTHKNEILTFDKAVSEDKTIALLIIKNDSILYEKYFYDFDKNSVQASFSMSKSFLSSLIAIAIDEGKIKTVNDSITKYLPNLDKEKFGRITIEHLLDMRSGILSKKDFLNPFGQIVKMYYGKNLRKYMNDIEIKQAPGLEYEYSNVNSQLLAIILENVTKKSVAENLEANLWKPLGMENDALWSVDSKKNNMVKAFCCMSATARDYAKIGRLYLNKGKWKNKQIIPENWVNKTTTFTNTKNDFRYSYHWKHAITYEVTNKDTKYPDLYVDGGYFIDHNNNKNNFIIHPYPAFFAVGILGQFTYVYPEKNIIIVRLGKQDKLINWEELFKEIVELN